MLSFPSSSLQPIHPPSAVYTLPVTNVLSGPSRNAITAPISSDVPRRLIALGSSCLSLPWIASAFVIKGVWIAPGASAFTLMSRCPTSFAATRTRPTTPCLLAPYEPCPGKPGDNVVRLCKDKGDTTYLQFHSPKKHKQSSHHQRFFLTVHADNTSCR